MELGHRTLRLHRPDFIESRHCTTCRKWRWARLSSFDQDTATVTDSQENHVRPSSVSILDVEIGASMSCGRGHTSGSWCTTLSMHGRHHRTPKLADSVRRHHTSSFILSVQDTHAWVGLLRPALPFSTSSSPMLGFSS